MSHASLPTPSLLEGLPLRGIVAYASHCANQVSEELHEIIGDDRLNDILLLLESVTKVQSISVLDPNVFMGAGIQLMELYSQSSSEKSNYKSFRKVLCLVHAATAAAHVILAARQPKRERFHNKRAAIEAARAADAINCLTSSKIDAAKVDARRCFDALVETYGTHKYVVIGYPLG